MELRLLVLPRAHAGRGGVCGWCKDENQEVEAWRAAGRWREGWMISATGSSRWLNSTVSQQQRSSSITSSSSSSLLPSLHASGGFRGAAMAKIRVSYEYSEAEDKSIRLGLFLIACGILSLFILGFCWLSPTLQSLQSKPANCTVSAAARAPLRAEPRRLTVFSTSVSLFQSERNVDRSFLSAGLRCEEVKNP